MRGYLLDAVSTGLLWLIASPQEFCASLRGALSIPCDYMLPDCWWRGLQLAHWVIEVICS